MYIRSYFEAKVKAPPILCRDNFLNRKSGDSHSCGWDRDLGVGSSMDRMKAWKERDMVKRGMVYSRRLALVRILVFANLVRMARTRLVSMGEGRSAMQT